LVKALKKDRAVWDRWQELASHRREYVETIEGKKAAGARRVEGAVRACRAPAESKKATPSWLFCAGSAWGKQHAPMKDLAMFEKAGCGEVKTYIQSGMSSFAPMRRSRPGSPTSSPRPFWRSQVACPGRGAHCDDLLRVTSSNPFIERGADTDKLHVVFLADRPPRPSRPARSGPLAPASSPFAVGRSTFIAPAASSRKPNAYFDAKLNGEHRRNWRTVLKLLELRAPW
jgi:uncharacterized protein (DUF1697 family)